MTKADFYKLIAAKSGITQKAVSEIMQAFEEVMINDIFMAEDSVRLGIGTFSGYTKVTSDKRGRNPKTGEEILIKGKVQKGYPKFKPSTATKVKED